MSIQRALAQRRVLDENKKLKEQLDLRFGMENIVGHDRRMLRIFDMIDSVADTRATVLITGESGTGKSLIARAIHRHSGRRNGPFVEIACGALPESLLESELFGHVAGAFTGALGDKKGKFLQADSGTIFLDEISTASPSMQVKLLRVLQDFEFEPVGGTKTFHVDTRVVLATNEDLSRAVAEGRFRQDLFYRINVINIELPPLRERMADIPLLGAAFSGQSQRGCGQTPGRFLGGVPGRSPRLPLAGQRARVTERGGARRAARQRQSRHARRSAPAGDGRLVGPRIGRCRPYAATSLHGPERQIILEALQAHNWSRNATADALGINRTTLYKKMKRLGLQDPRQCLGLATSAGPR